jgi:hypothetical protein
MLPPSWRSEIQNAIREIAPSKDKFKRAIDIATVVLLFATALFTALAWYVFRSQLQTFNEQLTEMRKVYQPINDQAVAAKDAAIAAQASASTAEKALIAGERPWIDITKIEIANDITFDTNGARISLNVTLLNRGRSPATNVFPWNSAYLQMSGISGTPEKKFVPPTVSIIDMEQPSILFPDVPTPREVSTYVWANQLAQLLAKSKTSLFPVTVETCASYAFSGMHDQHQTCHTLLLHHGPGRGLLMSLPDPLAPIPRDSIGFSYQPNGSIAN